MQDPKDFYKKEKQRYEVQFVDVKKQLNISSWLRLSTFLCIGFCIYFFYGNYYVLAAIGFVGILTFVYLLVRHSKLQYKRDFVDQLIRINEIEINALDRNYLTLDEGREFVNPDHFYSHDVDLFGRGSFFQFINRTVTIEGKKLLASRLTENDTCNIKLKQEALKDLSMRPKWRQQFSAMAHLVKVQHSSRAIIKWLDSYKPNFRGMVKWLPPFFSVVSITILGLTIAKILSPNILLVWFFIGLGISGFYLKKINIIYQNTDKAKSTFKQYYRLLKQIESIEFKSNLLLEKQDKIKTKDKKASVIFSEFSRLLDALDQRNNVLIAILGNAFFLRDLQIATKIEHWIEHYSNKVKNWFEVIAFIDAENSLANYVFNHPKFVFPVLKTEKSILNASLLGHPLLIPENRIDNDFNIQDQQFLIITGANMAGKSTFLRTVSLSIVMANMGLPVCATSFEYSPIKLITSMRTSDSLTDDESYFFSELKRLKFIIEAIKKEDYFIILDEILKGTNSTDKATGSKKFVHKLVNSNSTGIIATHDLSLCEIENELTEVKNYYFDVQIIDDDLLFDYKLKEGICENMNASFLLQKMNIV